MTGSYFDKNSLSERRIGNEQYNRANETTQLCVHVHRIDVRNMSFTSWWEGFYECKTGSGTAKIKAA